MIKKVSIFLAFQRELVVAESKLIAKFAENHLGADELKLVSSYGKSSVIKDRI